MILSIGNRQSAIGNRNVASALEIRDDDFFHALLRFFDWSTRIDQLHTVRFFERDLEETLVRAMLPPVFPVTLHDMQALKEIRMLRECDLLLLGPALDYAQDQLFVETPALGWSDAVRAGAVPTGCVLMLAHLMSARL